MDPELIMYDEPFAGLRPSVHGHDCQTDSRAESGLAGLTSLLVSHDVQESCSIADYVCVLSGGKVRFWYAKSLKTAAMPGGAAVLTR